MAFFRDHSSETTTHRAMEDKNISHTVNRVQNPIDIDLNSSENDFDMTVDGHYQSYGERDDSRPQNEGEVNGGVDMVPSTSHTYERRTGGSGKWGSTLFQNSQRTGSQNVSDSGHESRSGSEYRNDEGSDGNSSLGEDDYERELEKEMEKIPAEEMLSDEYYEQDGDDPNESLQYRNSKPTTSNSRPHSRLPPTTKLVLKSRRTADDDVYADEEDDDDEDVADGDDPEDADFDPDYGDTDGRAINKDDDWEVEESDEDVASDGDFDNSDDDDNDDAYFKKKPRGGPRGKFGRSAKAGKKPMIAPARRRKGRVSEDEFSAVDSDEDSDEGFRTKRSAHLRKSNNERRKNETRTSSRSRSMQKVSYVESDGSEEAEDEKNKKSQKEDFDEEDADTIERVLWHQPRGMAEEATKNNKSTEPVLLSHLFDTDPDWNEMEFLIKWKGQSHLHCQWKALVELQNLSGFKKLLNYMKRVNEDVKFRKSVSREEETLDYDI